MEAECLRRHVVELQLVVVAHETHTDHSARELLEAGALQHAHFVRGALLKQKEGVLGRMAPWGIQRLWPEDL